MLSETIIEDPEDVLASSLQSLYGYEPVTLTSAGSVFSYTREISIDGITKALGVELQTPDTEAANWELHASSIWASSRYIADHLEDLPIPPPGDRPVSILELGAGACLPGILLAKSRPHTAMVTASDYPDERLIATLSRNVVQNHASNNCRVVPYAWGSDPSVLLRDGGFDIVLAADTLWNPSTHDVFLETLGRVLAKTSRARIVLVAGLHTGRYTLAAFLKNAKRLFDVEAATLRRVNGTEQKEWAAAMFENDEESENRKWVVWISLKWRL